MIILQKITYLYHKQIGYLIYYIMFSKCEPCVLEFFRIPPYKPNTPIFFTNSVDI